LIVAGTLLSSASCETNGAKPNATSTSPDTWVDSNLSVAVDSSVSATLTWSPQANADYYRVYRNTTPTFDTYYNDVADIKDTNFQDDRLAAGTKYYYQVYWLKSDGSNGKIGQGSATLPATDAPLK
jgi:fibronectin type 3 domain-containing protein